MAAKTEPDERDGLRSALGNRGEHLAILGIGSAQGAPIRGEDGSFLKDAQGAILVPRLDAASLRRFASELGGQYRSARLDDSDLQGLDLLAGPEQLREGAEPTQLAAWADQGHWLLLPLLLLAACAGRRGWLFCLPLLLGLAPQPSYALGWNDLWLRPDQQGERLLQADKAKEAAEHFRDPQWQGEALYRAGDYPAAAERFARSDSAIAHYNRGNALAKSNELAAAVDAYEQALERDPELQPALHNKALVEQLLRQQKQQQQQSQQNDDPQQGEEQPQPSSGQPQPGQPQQAQDSQAPAQPQPAQEPPAQRPAAATGPGPRWCRSAARAGRPATRRRRPAGRTPERQRRAAGRRAARRAGTMAAADSGRPGRAAAAQIPLRTTATPGKITMKRLLCALLLCLCGTQLWAAGSPPPSTARA